MEARFRDVRFSGKPGRIALVAHGRDQGPGRDPSAEGAAPRAERPDLDRARGHLSVDIHLDIYPHSIERVPHMGAIMVAGSHGHLLRVYSRRVGDPGNIEYARSYPFRSAHGVLWDKANNTLWAAGGFYPRSYRVTGKGANVADATLPWPTQP
jgi:hypothetical protein